MLKPYQKVIIWLIRYIPVLVMITMSGMYVARQINVAIEQANRILVSELELRLGREVRVRHTSVRPFGVAVLEGVEVASGKKLSDGRMLTVSRLMVHYNLRDLILGGKGAQSVSSIVVDGPALNLIRRADGSFNILDLVGKPKGPPGPPFVGSVEVKGGSVVFTDHLAKVGKGPAVTMFRGIDGLLDAAGQPVYSFSVSAAGSNGKIGLARAVGKYDARSHQVDIDLTGLGAPASYWSDYFGLSKKVKVLGGKLKATLGVKYRRMGKSASLTLTGAIKVADGSIQLPMFTQPFTKVDGTLAIAGEKIAISAKGSVGGTRVAVTGSISDFAKPSFNLLAKSSGADFAGLMRVMKVPQTVREIRPIGSGPLQVSITGSAAEPVIDAVGVIPRVALRGYTSENVYAAATYKNNRVEFRGLMFSVMGGRFAGRGTIRLDGVPRLTAEGRAEGIPLAKLPLPSEVEATGTGNASFSVSGTLADPRVSASVSVSGIKIAGVPFDSAGAHVAYGGGSFKVTGLRAVGGPAGSVSVEGQVSETGMDVTVTTDGTDLGKLANLMGMDGIKGIGYIKAHAMGTLDKPRFTAEAELFDGNYRGYSIDHAHFSLAGDTRGVRISEAVISLYPAELKFSGQVGRLDADRIPFQLDGKVDRLTVSKLSQLIGQQLDVNGTFSGSIEASGIYSSQAGPGESPFVDVMADADMHLEHGTVLGMPISDARAVVGFANNKLEINQAYLTSQGATASIENVSDGQKSSVALDTGDINVRLKLSGLDLARVRDRIKDYAYVGGVFDAELRVGGTMDSPTVDASASVDHLSVNSRRFDKATFAATYAQDSVSSFGVALERGAQKFALTGKDFDPETMKFRTASGKIENVSVPDLWGILVDSPYIRSSDTERFQEALSGVPRIKDGIVNGSFAMSGSVARPTGTLSLTAKDIALDVRKIESVRIDAVADDGKVKLNEMRLDSQDAVVMVEGGFDIPERTVDLGMDVSKLDLSTLRPWFGESMPGGVMSTYLAVKGPLTQPSVEFSVEVQNPSFDGVKFDALRTGPITVKNDRIEFDEVFLTSGNQKLVEASGYVPWDWSQLTVPTSKPMELKVALKQHKLSVISQIVTNLVDAEKTTGDVQASLDVRGTISKPELSGNLKVQDGTLAIKSFTNEFTNTNVDLSFSGNRIDVNQFSTASSLGGTLSVLPGGHISLGSVTGDALDLKVLAAGLVVGERDGLGFKEDVNTMIDAGLSVTGSLKSPLIADAALGENADGSGGVAGGITLTKSRIAFAAPTGTSIKFEQALPIEPRFNVSLRVGTNVWIFPPSMAMHVMGKGTLKGTISKPQLALNLEVVEGNLKLAGSRLSVVPGGTIAVVFSPPAAPDLRVDFKAYTSVTATSQFGQRERFRIDMTARGAVGNLQVDLASSPDGLTREQMLAALGRVEGILGGGEAQLQKELGSVLTAVGSSTLFAPIESVFVDKLGFDQFTLEYAADRPLALYISRRLVSNLYLSYYGRLTSQLADTNDANYEINLGYRFAEKYSFSLGVNDQATTTLQSQYTFHF